LKKIPPSLDLPELKQRGVYILSLFLSEKKEIEIGKIGIHEFNPGFYYYIGSAWNKGGIASRLSHHINISTKPHWHIDYLRKKSSLNKIYFVAGLRELEHSFADSLSKFLITPIKHFGSSDCKCQSHLFYSKKESKINKLLDNLLHITIKNR
jgi:Uri superfamily endonuclease